MKLELGHLVAAAALIGAFALGGAALASAREVLDHHDDAVDNRDGSSTTDRATPNNRKNCDHGDRSGDSSDSGDSSGSSSGGETQGSSL